MMAVVTSIGELTTDACVWALERQGFKVWLLKDQSTLWEKLKVIYDTIGDDFIRVDADVIVNKNVRQLVKQNDLWWYQALTFDWYKQDSTHGGVQFIRRKALPFIRKHISEAEFQERPESHLYRLEAFHNPRKCGVYDEICGLTNYKCDMRRVKEVKERRGQVTNYDWELAMKIESL